MTLYPQFPQAFPQNLSRETRQKSGFPQSPFRKNVDKRTNGKAYKRSFSASAERFSPPSRPFFCMKPAMQPRVDSFSENANSNCLRNRGRSL
jgi:hypothetical protein